MEHYEKYRQECHATRGSGRLWPSGMGLLEPASRHNDMYLGVILFFFAVGRAVMLPGGNGAPEVPYQVACEGAVGPR